MDPSAGTFISMDTYEGSIYDPDTLHKYLYANGNPVTYSDPSGNFFSAVGTLVATTISTVYNHFDTLNVMGLISGVTNSAITAFLGGSDMEITKAFVTGYLTGFGLGAVMYVAAAFEIMTLAQMYLVVAAADTVMSIVMTIGAIVSGNKKAAIVYGTLSILSLFTFCQMYKINHCTVKVVGDKGSAKIGWEYSNPEEVTSDSVYIPRDTDGNPVPLNKQRINGQDIPLPDPAAEGRPHTVLGGKISSETGEIYRQTATFNGGSWPTANGYEVPISEVHWTDHGRPYKHTNPHQHVFIFDFVNKCWYRSDPEIF